MSHHTPESLLAALTQLGISYQNHHHVAVFTVAESQAHTASIPGQHIKNLFLKDKANTFFLVTACEDRTLNLRALGKHLGAKDSLSFTDAPTLLTRLGVTPGSVSPLALINAPSGSVRFVLDEAIMAAPLVNPHPLINTQTTSLSPQALVQACTHWGHPPLLLNLGLFPKAAAA